MNNIVIRVNNLSKQYQIGKSAVYQTLREQIVNSISKPFRKKEKSEIDKIWALKNVSFEVKKGEVIGIIGPNGAGKSTLLKILSRITEPTKGSVEINGRVASLLEVGTGFNSELTGRENIYLNGAILGMKKAEINQKFDEIVDFAGIPKFLDTPVKHYSSGMYMRLAFAVAAHLEPEILLIDEVLAVGDIEFQKKCLGKMGEVAKAGRTVLFVSHNMQAISTLVDQCIYLKSGKLIKKGEKNQVIKTYMEDVFDKKKKLIYIDKQSSHKPKVTRVKVNTSNPNNYHVNFKPLEVEVDFSLPEKIKKTCITIVVKDKRGIFCLDFSYFDPEIKYNQLGNYRLKFYFPKFRLYMGKYTLNLYFSEPPGGDFFQLIEDICPFEVVMHGKSRGDWEWQPYTTTYIEDYSCSITKTNQ